MSGKKHSAELPKSELIDDELPVLFQKQSAVSPSRQAGMFWRIFSVLRFIPLLMLFIATVGVSALYFQPPGLQKLMQLLNLQPGEGTSSPIAVPNARPKTTSDLPAAPQPIIGLGILVPEGDVTRIDLPFGSGDARISQILVSEGQSIGKGDLLARLDNENNIKAQIANARANVASREAQLEQTRQSVTASIAETSAALRQAQAALINAQGEYDRAKSLFDRGYTTNSVLDQRKSAKDQAASETARLQATLARFGGTELNDQSDVKVAQRNLESAKADLARAENDLSKALVQSPVDGTVIKIHARAGERPTSGGLMDIGNIDHMTAEVEIYQTEIGNVQMGASARLTAEALSVGLTGTVTKIGLEVGRQSLVDSGPAANTDARVVEVTVTLDEASSKAARRFTNLQVIARIERIVE